MDMNTNNDKIKLLMADDNEELRAIFSNYFKNQSDIELVGIYDNGLDAFHSIKQNCPDVAVLDIIIPKLDGLAILEGLKEDGLCYTKIIMLTAVTNVNYTHKSLNLGAEYFMSKPFEIDVLARRIRELSKKTNKVYLSNQEKAPNKDKELYEKVTNVLNTIGFAPNLKGYQYLRSGIILCIHDTEFLSSITKLLYPTIAKQNNTVNTRVERAIRHSIETTWAKGSMSNYIELLGYTPFIKENLKPTNGEFIASIVEYIKKNI